MHRAPKEPGRFPLFPALPDPTVLEDRAVAAAEADDAVTTSAPRDQRQAPSTVPAAPPSAVSVPSARSRTTVSARPGTLDVPEAPDMAIDTADILPDLAAHRIFVKLESLGFIR